MQEILKVAIKSALNIKKFLVAYNNGSAERAFQSDLAIRDRLNIHSLPSYLIQYKNEGALIQNLVDYNGFVDVFYNLSRGLIKPEPPEQNIETLRVFLNKHPLISPIELREAFNFGTIEEVKSFITPLLDKEIKIIEVLHG